MVCSLGRCFSLFQVEIFSFFVRFRGCICCYDILFMEGIQPTTYDWCKISEPSKSTPLEIPVLKPQNEGSGQTTFLFKPGGFQVPGVNFPGCMMLDCVWCLEESQKEKSG